MTYEMIQSTLTLVIKAAVCSLPIIWLHYLYSSGRCPTTVRELSERCSTGIRSLSESGVVELRKNFVEQFFGIPLVLELDSDKLFDTFHSDSEDIAVEHLSNSERISSDTSRTLLEQPVEQSWLNRVKRYQLHGYEVVFAKRPEGKVADLMISLPAGVKRYRLRSQAVVRVQDLLFGAVSMPCRGEWGGVVIGIGL